jgi:hypothetical protein
MNNCTCGQPATWIFNDFTRTCNDCHDERLHDAIIDTEDNLSWPIGESPLARV